MTAVEFAELVKAFGPSGAVLAAAAYLLMTRKPEAPGRSALEEDIRAMREDVKAIREDGKAMRELISSLRERVAHIEGSLRE